MNFASKKFTVVMAALVFGFILELAGKLSGNFATIVTVAVAAYQLAQGATDYAKAKNGHGAA